MEKIAEFEVKDSLIIADPCYERDKKLEVKLKARKGTWAVYIERNGSSGVDFINAHHINYIGGLNKEIAGVGVDSGQFGIWDKDFWKSNNNGGEYGDVNSWYGAICMTMECSSGASKYGEGAVVSTGGDGYFPIYAVYDEKNVVLSR